MHRMWLWRQTSALFQSIQIPRLSAQPILTVSRLVEKVVAHMYVLASFHTAFFATRPVPVLAEFRGSVDPQSTPTHSLLSAITPFYHSSSRLAADISWCGLLKVGSHISTDIRSMQWTSIARSAHRC